MNAPDKIYLDIRYNNDEYPKEVFATRALESDVEYIRKDALLEWAKEHIEDYMSDFQQGQNYAFEQLIEKLEQL